MANILTGACQENNTELCSMQSNVILDQKCQSQYQSKTISCGRAHILLHGYGYQGG